MQRSLARALRLLFSGAGEQPSSERDRRIRLPGHKTLLYSMNRAAEVLAPVHLNEAAGSPMPRVHAVSGIRHWGGIEYNTLLCLESEASFMITPGTKQSKARGVSCLPWILNTRKRSGAECSRYSDSWPARRSVRGAILRVLPDWHLGRDRNSARSELAKCQTNFGPLPCLSSFPKWKRSGMEQ